VDDEQHVVDGLRRALEEYAYSIQTATSAELALRKFAAQPFDVIVADERMPGMQGSELLTLIANEFPTTGRILLTGYGTPEAAARAVNEAGVVRFLVKPCPPQQVHDAIEVALRTTPFEKRVRTGRKRSYLVTRKAETLAQKATNRPSARTAPPSARDSSVNWLNEVPRLARVDLEANELVLQAQRIVELGSERLRGFELSMRLRTRDGCTHTLGNFVSSSIGQHVLLSAVDRWVVRHVLQSIREQSVALEQQGLTVSLNIATQSLADPEFVQFLDRELTDVRVASRFLMEVRESALAKCVRRDQGLLARLTSMKCFDSGVRLCVDGVGGAIWKLGLLKDLPVAVAKIDSRFICDILTSKDSESVVRCAVEWGQQTGAVVVATGVDTPAIAHRLRTLGVHYGQGIAFSGTETVGSGLASLFC
jgi:EAL domain-containing protein (putative c-di-GMP-specific phosphodiesterase class I)/CheY-like chemotaxis protein